jgi:hypothetical protein
VRKVFWLLLCQVSPAYSGIEDFVSFNFLQVRTFCLAGNFKQSRFTVVSKVPDGKDLFVNKELDILNELAQRTLDKVLVDA